LAEYNITLSPHWLGDTEAAWQLQDNGQASHWLKLILISHWLGDTEAAWQDSCLASYWLWPHHHSSHRQKTHRRKNIGLFVIFMDHNFNILKSQKVRRDNTFSA
jgi:hypothetical protein